LTTTEVLAIASPLLGTITALATYLYRQERERRLKAEKQNDQLVGIIVARAAKSDETMREFAEFLRLKGQG
jgi:hypothetical protein